MGSRTKCRVVLGVLLTLLLGPFGTFTQQIKMNPTALSERENGNPVQVLPVRSMMIPLMIGPTQAVELLTRE